MFTHCAVVKQDVTPFIFHTEEGEEDDHKQESDYTENNHQATVSHQEREQEEFSYQFLFVNIRLKSWVVNSETNYGQLELF